jgi:hypothetical protein
MAGHRSSGDPAEHLRLHLGFALGRPLIAAGQCAWYNKENKRVGTLWEERFKSVLLQGGGALATVAAYIDLNPVRAKIVEDPADYRWSGYGEACFGVAQSRRALRELVAFMRAPGINSLGDAMRWYRVYIYEECWIGAWLRMGSR